MSLNRKEQVTALSALVRGDKALLAQLIERATGLTRPVKINALVLLSGNAEPSAIAEALGIGKQPGGKP